MARRKGADLAILLGGTAIASALGWSLEHTSVNVEGTAAGDAVVDRDHFRDDYTVEFNGRIEIAAPYVLPTNLLGTKAAWAGKLVDDDANGLASSTGLVTMLKIDGQYDRYFEISGRIQAAGTPITYDLSPAT